MVDTQFVKCRLSTMAGHVLRSEFALRLSASANQVIQRQWPEPRQTNRTKVKKTNAVNWKSTLVPSRLPLAAGPAQGDDTAPNRTTAHWRLPRRG